MAKRNIKCIKDISLNITATTEWIAAKVKIAKIVKNADQYTRNEIVGILKRML